MQYNAGRFSKEKPKKFEIWHESFGFVLDETLASMNMDERIKFMETLKKSGSPYAKHIAETTSLEEFSTKGRKGAKKEVEAPAAQAEMSI